MADEQGHDRRSTPAEEDLNWLSRTLGWDLQATRSRQGRVSLSAALLFWLCVAVFTSAIESTSNMPWGLAFMLLVGSTAVLLHEAIALGVWLWARKESDDGP